MKLPRFTLPNFAGLQLRILKLLAVFDGTAYNSIASPYHLPTVATQQVSQSYHSMLLNMCFVIASLV